MYDLNKIREYMDTSCIGSTIVQFESLKSTSHKVKNILGKCPDGAVVLCEYQENCQLRFGRTWYCHPNDNIYMSIILKPETVELMQSKLYAVVTAAVCTAVNHMFDGIGCLVKWPNDIFLRGMKICSTYAETVLKKDRQIASIVSINLNADMEQSDLRDELKSFSSTLRCLTEVKINREMLIGFILNYLEKYYRELKEKDSADSAVSVCLESSILAGRRIEVYKPGKKTSKQFTAETIDLEGWLVALNERGNEETLNPGDVSIRL